MRGCLVETENIPTKDYDVYNLLVIMEHMKYSNRNPYELSY